MDMFIRRAEAATETGARNCAAVMTDVDAMIPPPTISQQILLMNTKCEENYGAIAKLEAC